MIVDERIVSYINSLNTGDDEIVETIEKEARAAGVPIIRNETKEWIRTMLLITKPKRVLEVGTAVGYSAIFMSRYLPEDARIITIEKWKPRVEQAIINFKRAGVSDRITLLEGDAADILVKLVEECYSDGYGYDFIFMDAAKGQYINFLPNIIRLLNDNGVLISDNVLQDGEILDSKFVVERRNRTIHGRMREYLYELKHNEYLDTSIIPLGDGIALSVKGKVGTTN